MAVTFNEATRALLDGKNFATIATVNPDGAPQSSVIWVKRDGDTVLYSTARGRRKARNHERDPRVSLSIFDLADPYQYVEIRGRVELAEDHGRKLVNELAHKYIGEDYPGEPDDVQRVVVRIIPEKITGRSV